MLKHKLCHVYYADPFKNDEFQSILHDIFFGILHFKCSATCNESHLPNKFRRWSHLSAKWIRMSDFYFVAMAMLCNSVRIVATEWNMRETASEREREREMKKFIAWKIWLGVGVRMSHLLDALNRWIVSVEAETIPIAGNHSISDNSFTTAHFYIAPLADELWIFLIAFYRASCKWKFAWTSESAVALIECDWRPTEAELNFGVTNDDV